MFKKIEIWILYLVLVFVFISYIVFGAMVRREILGGTYIPVISQISRVAIFISEIPSKLSRISNSFNPYLYDDKYENWNDNFKLNNNYLKSIQESSNYLLVSSYEEQKRGNLITLLRVSNQKRLLEFPIISKSRIFHPTVGLVSGNVITKTDGELILLKNLKEKKKLKSKKFKFHHSSEFDHNEDIWVCATNKENIKSTLVDDYLVKLNKSGDILFEKSLYDCLSENNLAYLIAPTTNNPFAYLESNKIDIFHLNDIEPVFDDGKFWRRGDIFISLRNRSLILLYRPETNKILWHKNGPWMNQHDVDIIDSKRISIFGNDVIDISSENNKYFKSYYGHNNIYIYNFENELVSTPYRNIMKKLNISTPTEGLHRIMSNGDAFVEDSNNHILYYFNKNDFIWKYKKKNKSGKLSLFSWSSLLKFEEVKNLIDLFGVDD